MSYEYLMNLIPDEKYHIDIEIIKGTPTGNAGLDHLNSIDCDGNELYMAIVTCGMPVLSYIKKGQHDREEELRLKIAAFNNAFTVVKKKNKNLLVRRDDYLLDATEKGFISYYAGMFMTRLISMQEGPLFADYLVHAKLVKSKYAERCGFNLSILNRKEARQEPDLIGYRKSDDVYCIYEAKCTDSSARIQLKKAEDQIKSISTINNQRPAFGVSCHTGRKRDCTKITLSICWKDEFQKRSKPDNWLTDISDEDLTAASIISTSELIEEMNQKNKTEMDQCWIEIDENITIEISQDPIVREFRKQYSDEKRSQGN